MILIFVHSFFFLNDEYILSYMVGTPCQKMAQHLDRLNGWRRSTVEQDATAQMISLATDARGVLRLFQHVTCTEIIK